MRKLIIACALLAAAPAGAVEVGGAETIRTRTLDNGLKIIVWPDHDIPNVVIYNFVRAGARNERPGITGLSHFFEHMMFNGTETLEPGEFDRIMEANGGANNAYTSNDVTVYQDWLPASALGVVLDLEADRFANLSFDPDVVESERGVVFSERRSSVDNNNSGHLFEEVNATAFVAHPYQFPVIGWPSDIEAWSLDDLKSYFTTYYAPNNCTMIIAGAVEPDEVFALLASAFGEIPKQEPPPRVRTVEPEQLGERRLVVRKPVQTPLLQVAYKSPPAKDPAGPALDLLLSILADGESSRLHRALVEESRVAISVGTYRHEGFDPASTWFFVTLPSDGDVHAAEDKLYAELKRVAQDGVTDSELNKAKNIIVADFWRGMETINGKASALGNYEVFHGDYRKLFDIPEAYQSVTSEDLRQVARAVFDPRRRTVGIMISPAEEQEDAS